MTDHPYTTTVPRITCVTRLVAALGLACLAALPPAGAQTSPAAAGRVDGAALDRIVDTAVHRGFAGVVLVGALDAGAGAPVLYARAVGLADREAGRAHAVDEVWAWASVTKQVTAALVLGEVAAGRLALDTPAARYWPALAGRPAGLATLRQLLQHTAGLPNPDDTPPDAAGVPAFYRATGRGVGDVAAARGYCAGPPKRAPGQRFEYNNCDYLVLGAVLAHVTGRPYATLVRERIAEPLGLRAVALVADGAAAPVPGYTAAGARAPAVNLATAGAAGALAGTPRDLLAFDAALAAYRLVPAAATAEMWRGDRALGYVALGAWAFPATLRGCTGPVPLVERRGAFAGVEVRNVIAPTLGRAVLAFTNAEGVDFGEVWQARGLTYELLSAALCPAAPTVERR